MSRSKNPFLAFITGPPECERYVIKRNFFEPPDFFTGLADDPWTEDLGKARPYASIDDLSQDHRELAMRELAHLPQTTYRLEVEVAVIGEVAEDRVREYLFDALKIGLDYESFGPGPGIGTLVVVKTDTGSLSSQDPEHEAPKPR